jgi:glutathione S-transferase
VHRQEVLRDYFDGMPALGRWLQRMSAFSAASAAQSVSGAEAVAIAAAAAPTPLVDSTIDPALALDAGAAVTVAAIDYGRDPIAGTLLAADEQRIVIAREDARAGALQVHFPRYGFEVSPAG